MSRRLASSLSRGVLLNSAIHVLAGSPCDELSALSIEQRVQGALASALVADAVVARGDLLAPGGGDQTEWGDELVETLRVISSKGFQFDEFAAAWRTWALGYHGDLGPGARETLRSVAAGVAPSSAPSHYTDLRGAVRAPALLLLAGRVDGESLVLASREVQQVTHENPKALQAGELIIRAALILVDALVASSGSKHAGTACRADGGHGAASSKVVVEPRRLRRAAMAEALLQAAAQTGLQYRSVIDQAVTEATTRDNLVAAGGGDGPVAAFHTDSAVLGRLTSSGWTPSADVHTGLIPFVMPAIIWFAVAYDSLTEAAAANLALGGASAARGIFIGLLYGARDGFPQVQGGVDSKPWAIHLRSKVLSFLPPLSLCTRPGHCQAGGAASAERRMRGVTVSAAIVGEEASDTMFKYRVFVLLDASELLARPVVFEKPSDWDDDEDGDWEPPTAAALEGHVGCLARYFQFALRSGRHAPLSVWPANRLWQLSRASPAACDSFVVETPERVRSVIGGVVLGEAKLDVKLPTLVVDEDAEPPPWTESCSHVGVVRLPDARWRLVEEA